MGAQLYFGVIIVAVLATIDATTDIKVACEEDSVMITWRINAALVPYAARFFLGSCLPSKFNVLPNGEGEVHFNYYLVDCKFKRQLKGRRLLYQNELTFRPNKKSEPAAFVYPIECAYISPVGWVPTFLDSGSSFSEGRGSLVFHMALLNAQLTGVAKTNVIPLGSFMPIWAAVEQKSHQPLLLLMEECVAATTPKLQLDSPVYPIIGNKGCLLESMKTNSVFLPRYHSSALILSLQSFKFGLGKEVYIHCKLVAWDPEALDESKKACQYVKGDQRWQLFDDPSKSSVCSCCDSSCTHRLKRDVEWESNGFSHNSVLGPLIIIDPSDSNVNDILEVSLTAAEVQ